MFDALQDATVLSPPESQSLALQQPVMPLDTHRFVPLQFR